MCVSEGNPAWQIISRVRFQPCYADPWCLILILIFVINVETYDDNINMNYHLVSFSHSSTQSRWSTEALRNILMTNQACRPLLLSQYASHTMQIPQAQSEEKWRNSLLVCAGEVS
jgi:hypothetical protein